MNLSILSPEIQNFISENLNTNISKILLKGSPFPKVSAKELAEQIEAKNKCIHKLPTWFQTENIYFPNKLNIEQTSSELTAKHKSKIVNGDLLIDITGGYGIDSYYFSKKVNKIIHCELNENLSKIVQHNFEILKAPNITNHFGNGIDFVINHSETIDWLFIDPSRRHDSKGKVFLLQDCTPNLPKNLEKLLKKTNHILVKNSPILDITSTIKELQYIKEIQIVAIKNEVKEVLIHIEKNNSFPISIKTYNYLDTTTYQYFEFLYKQETTISYNEPIKYLYEPNAAIFKSEGYDILAEKKELYKLGKNSHLYTSNILVEYPGRVFQIETVMPYNKKNILKQLPTKKANISIRNFKESVAQIRKKTGIKDGGNDYLFFTTNQKDKPIVIFCKKVQSTS